MWIWYLLVKASWQWMTNLKELNDKQPYNYVMQLSVTLEGYMPLSVLIFFISFLPFYSVFYSFDFLFTEFHLFHCLWYFILNFILICKKLLLKQWGYNFWQIILPFIYNFYFHVDMPQKNPHPDIQRKIY
jgi:hypothetical protein